MKRFQTFLDLIEGGKQTTIDVIVGIDDAGRGPVKVRVNPNPNLTLTLTDWFNIISRCIDHEQSGHVKRYGSCYMSRLFVINTTTEDIEIKETENQRILYINAYFQAAIVLSIYGPPASTTPIKM